MLHISLDNWILKAVVLLFSLHGGKQGFTNCQIVLPSGAVRVFSWGAGKWNETKAAGLSEPVHIRQLPLFNVHCLSLFPAGSLLWQSWPFQSHPSGMVLLLSIQAAPIPRACTVQENQVCVTIAEMWHCPLLRAVFYRCFLSIHLRNSLQSVLLFQGRLFL